MSIKHKHHIIPKHAGGTDDPSNIVELTVEEHAAAHKVLYEKYGRWQDELAWKSLSGMIGKEEIIRIAQSKADKTWMKTERGKEAFAKRSEKLKGRIPWNKGLTKETNPIVRGYAEKVKKTMKSGKVQTIGDIMRGKPFTEEHKAKLSQIKKNTPPKTCEHCGREVSAAMHTRWHGDKCKNKT